jgi:hypothetical protein
LVVGLEIMELRVRERAFGIVIEENAFVVA